MADASVSALTSSRVFRVPGLVGIGPGRAPTVAGGDSGHLQALRGQSHCHSVIVVGRKWSGRVDSEVVLRFRCVDSGPAQVDHEASESHWSSRELFGPATRVGGRQTAVDWRSTLSIAQRLLMAESGSPAARLPWAKELANRASATHCRSTERPLTRQFCMSVCLHCA